MAAQTGNISEAVRDIIKISKISEIPTLNLGFKTIESSKEVLARDRNSDRQPEIAILLRKPVKYLYLQNCDR